MRLLRECGLSLAGEDGQLVARASNFPLEVLYLRNADIPRYVEGGVADLAIVGRNTVEEEGCRVETLLGVANLDPSAGCLSGQRQLAAATAACNALKDALDAQRRGFGLDAVGVCVDEALQALYELTGEGADEAVIDQVFSRFCVGK